MDETSGMAELSGMHAAALEAFPYPVLIHDRDAILLANAAMRRELLAESPEDLVGKPMTAVSHPDVRAAGDERQRLLFERRVVTMSSVPVKLLALDGSTRYAVCDGGVIEYDGRVAVLITARFVGRSLATGDGNGSGNGDGNRRRPAPRDSSVSAGRTER